MSLVVWAAWHINYFLFHGWVYSIINEKNDMDLKAIKADKATDKLFQVIYFSIIVVYGWLVLSQTEYLPFSLGGAWDNDMKNMWSELPVITSDYLPSLRFYYLSTLGYHINSLRALAWAWFTNKSKGDWVEMLLHHLLTVSLYSFSYLTNSCKIGSLVMYLHDWADIWTPFAKLWVETDYKNLCIFGGVMIWFTWTYTRLIIFP